MIKLFIKLLIFYIIVALFISCNDNKEKNETIITIETVIKRNDSIRVFYTTDETINFSEEQTVRKRITGSTKNQVIFIEIPENTKPKQIRIDFGSNIKNQEIVLNKIKISYHEAKFEAKGEEIYRYFRPDENNTILNKKSGILKRKDSAQINGPSLYPKGDKLTEQLHILYKNGVHAK
jgi:hypothetical protein